MAELGDHPAQQSTSGRIARAVVALSGASGTVDAAWQLGDVLVRSTRSRAACA